MDLSKLSDEQLQVYHDLLSKKAGKEIPDNPSDSIPKAPTPQPDALKGKNSFRDLLSNIPVSTANSAMNLAKGAIQTEGDTVDPKHLDMNADIKSIYNTFRHPIQSMVGDPVGTATAGRMALEGGKGTVSSGAGDALAGAGRAASEQVRPMFNNLNLIHPGRMIPDIYDAGKNIVQGGIDAVRHPKTSPFDIRAMRSMPSNGGSPMTPKPTGIMGDVLPSARNGTSWPETPLAQDVGKNSAQAYKQLELMGKISKPLWKPANAMSQDIIPVQAPETPLPAPITPQLPSGRVPGPVQSQAPSPSQVRPLNHVEPQPQGPAPAPIGPTNKPSLPSGRAPGQIRPLETQAPEVNKDVESKYGELAMERAADQFDKIKAKDLNIAKNLKDAGVDEKTWLKATPEQRDAMAKSIKFPEGHQYEGRSMHKGAPNEDWRISHIGTLLR